MSIYVILVVLMLPGQAEPARLLATEWMTASTPAVCQQRANKLADDQRQQWADTVRRMGATVQGVCRLQGQMPGGSHT